MLYRPAGPILRAFDAQRLALLRTLVPPPARVLDAGAGNGRFVTAAAAAGYQATGIEPSRRGIERARARNVAITAATIETAQVAEGSLDAVTLWHVLEHIDDPGAALRRIAGWLAPAGALLVGVPNLASVRAQVGGARWFHLDVPATAPISPLRAWTGSCVAAGWCRCPSITGCSSTIPTGCGSRSSTGSPTTRPICSAC